MTTNDFRVTPLRRRLQQVAMTYVTRPLFWWVCALSSLFVGGVIILALSEGRDSTYLGLLLIIAFPAILFSALLALHAKWQFVNPVARLLPGYRTPHIALLALLTVLVLGAVPVLGSMVTGASPLGFAALLIAVTGPLLWAAQSNQSVWAFLAMGIGYSSVHPIVSPFWLDPNLPYWLNRLLILLAGWGLVGFWLWRLTSLHEERSDYNIPPISAQFGRASRSERAEQRKLVARTMKKFPLQGWLADRAIDQELAEPQPPPSRLLRLGFGAMSAKSRAVGSFLFFGVVFFVVTIVMIHDRANGGVMPRGFLAGPVMFACMMPASFLGLLFTIRRSYMETELLCPMTREDYVAGVIQAALRDGAIQMVALVGVVFALAGYFSPEMMTPPSVIGFLAVAVLCNLYLASFSIWIASYRLGMFQLFLPILSLIPIALVGLGFTGIWWKMTKGNPGMSEQVGWSIVALGLASTLPLLGLFFLRKAKRRWMEVELG